MSDVVDFKLVRADKTNNNKDLSFEQLVEIIKKDETFAEATSWIVIPGRISDDAATIDLGPVFKANINQPQAVMLLNLANQRLLGVL